MDKTEKRYTEKECDELFSLLFPKGFGGTDVRRKIAPEGWEHSPLRLVFHPTLKQRHKEAVRFHRNLEFLSRKTPKRLRKPAPTLKTVAKDYKDPPVDTGREIPELVGLCLWDIFSDNHDVVGPTGKLVDIGSFRGAAGFIADTLNREIRTPRYDYMDFYMGTAWVSLRTDLTPVYEMILSRLKARRFDWHYNFPTLRIVRLSKSSAEEISQAKKLDAELKKNRRRVIRKAKQAPPPSTVRAYLNVYACSPEGWPPQE